MTAIITSLAGQYRLGKATSGPGGEEGGIVLDGVYFPAESYTVHIKEGNNLTYADAVENQYWYGELTHPELAIRSNLEFGYSPSFEVTALYYDIAAMFDNNMGQRSIDIDIPAQFLTGLFTLRGWVQVANIPNGDNTNMDLFSLYSGEVPYAEFNALPDDCLRLGVSLGGTGIFGFGTTISRGGELSYPPAQEDIQPSFAVEPIVRMTTYNTPTGFTGEKWYYWMIVVSPTAIEVYVEDASGTELHLRQRHVLAEGSNLYPFPAGTKLRLGCMATPTDAGVVYQDIQLNPGAAVIYGAPVAPILV